MNRKPQYKSEIYIPSVGMLVVTWYETIYGNIIVQDIEGIAGHSQNCLMTIPGFKVLLMRALVRRTQNIKAALADGESPLVLPR